MIIGQMFNPRVKEEGGKIMNCFLKGQRYVFFKNKG